MKSIRKLFGNKSKLWWVYTVIMSIAFIVACVFPMKPTVSWRGTIVLCGFVFYYGWYLKTGEEVLNLRIFGVPKFTLWMLRVLSFALYTLLLIVIVFSANAVVGFPSPMTRFIFFVIGMSGSACMAVILGAPRRWMLLETKN